jgi:hypothetical protein
MSKSIFTPGKTMSTAQPKSILQIVSSKFSALSLSLLLTVTALLNAPSLEAEGWGITTEVVEFDNISWQQVFYDMNDVYFTALLPNYQSGQLNNGFVSLYGLIDDYGYVVTTPFMSQFNPPNSVRKFAKLIQDANPEFIVTKVDATTFGAKYAVDLIPVDQEVSLYWRFLSTENRLIKMGTEDSSESRRQNFFDSIKVK